jgi:tryptophan-rich sensory protein
MVYRVIIFLILNFVGLAIGVLYTGDGTSSQWYTDINKAPWTPPGWLFGVAWTIIMVCFSFYLAFLWPKVKAKKKLVIIYLLQWALNVAWNPIFFYSQSILAGLIVITSLTTLIGILAFYFWTLLRVKSTLVLPYLIWLIIATSLNAYIYIYN